MYKVIQTSRFRKEYKLMKKRGLDVSLLKAVVKKLEMGEKLPQELKDHSLNGNIKGYRECHIQNDWLLIYKYDHGRLILSLEHTGTHSDLFNE